MASESSNRTPDGIVVFLGTAAAFVVVAATFGWALGIHAQVDQVEQQRARQRIEARTKIETDAQARLAGEGWVDKAKGTVHVPIADAMKMAIADLMAKKPAPSSVKVEPPLPMPVADPASKEPAPPALPSAPQGADTVQFPVPSVAQDLPPPAATPAPAAAPAAEKSLETPPRLSVPADAPASPIPAIPPAPAQEDSKPSQEKPGDPHPNAPDAPAPAPASNPAENPAPTK